jgi:hypothetical protein
MLMIKPRSLLHLPNSCSPFVRRCRIIEIKLKKGRIFFDFDFVKDRQCLQRAARRLQRAARMRNVSGTFRNFPLLYLPLAIFHTTDVTQPRAPRFASRPLLNLGPCHLCCVAASRWDNDAK